MEHLLFSELVGKTILSIEINANEEIKFKCSDNSVYLMFHEQDCCENVHITDIVGDITDLMGQKIVEAREETNANDPEGKENSDDSDESNTWTFYIIRTNIATVTIRWHGSSNGYYSERVSFVKKSDV